MATKKTTVKKATNAKSTGGKLCKSCQQFRTSYGPKGFKKFHETMESACFHPDCACGCNKPRKYDGPKLPDGVDLTDLLRPHYDAPTTHKLAKREDGYSELTFELWYTERFGWVIPTLQIRKSSRAGLNDRTYATTLHGEACRVGMGPHVKESVKVHVREGRKDALKKFLDLQAQGAEKAHEIRDTISTRRAQGSLRRGGLFMY